MAVLARGGRQDEGIRPADLRREENVALVVDRDVVTAPPPKGGGFPGQTLRHAAPWLKVRAPECCEQHCDPDPGPIRSMGTETLGRTATASVGARTGCSPGWCRRGSRR